MLHTPTQLPVDTARILNSGVDLLRFFERLSATRECVLLTDYDGTLAPFNERPERARPYPDVVAALTALIEQGSTRVVIVSGREVSELLPLLPFERRPEIWGAHGWQRLTQDGRLIEHEARPEARARLDEAAREAREALARAGARLESKPASVALHWRGLPTGEIGEIRRAIAAAWLRQIDGGYLELLEFDGGLELRAVGHNKHDAVRTVLSETAGDGVAAYFGDDATDEDAFVAMKPRGLAVLVRQELRPTAADVWLKPPDGLVAFLERWKEGRNAWT